MLNPDPSKRCHWSVVIPTLQEAQQLPLLLAQLQGPEEVWVVDGGGIILLGSCRQDASSGV